MIFETVKYSIGVDLGQQHDHTAVAIIESAENRTRLLHLQRIQLGTPYPDAVSKIKSIATSPMLQNRCSVIVDATGVGAPVVDLLKRAQLRCQLIPVTITSGERASSDGIAHRVPKRDLIAGLQVLFEDPKFEIASGLTYTKALIDELARMRATVSAAGHDRYNGDKDDLVLALSLAAWWSRKKVPGVHGTRRLL